MADIAATSPLAHRDAIARDDLHPIAISEITDLALIELRLRPDNHDAVAAAEDVLGSVLPKAPRISMSAGDLRVMWLSPDRWLIAAPLARRMALMDTLSEALAGKFASVTDFSDGLATIRLSGSGARETLMKATSINLSEDDAGCVRGLELAGAAATVLLVQDRPETIIIHVGRSFADHLFTWLETASRSTAAVRLFALQDPPAC